MSAGFRQSNTCAPLISGNLANGRTQMRIPALPCVRVFNPFSRVIKRRRTRSLRFCRNHSAVLRQSHSRGFQENRVCRQPKKASWHSIDQCLRFFAGNIKEYGFDHFFRVPD